MARDEWSAPALVCDAIAKTPDDHPLMFLEIFDRYHRASRSTQPVIAALLGLVV